MGAMGILFGIFTLAFFIGYMVYQAEKGYRFWHFIIFGIFIIGFSSMIYFDVAAKPTITDQVVVTNYLPDSSIVFTKVTKVKIHKVTYPNYSGFHTNKTTYTILD